MPQINFGHTTKSINSLDREIHDGVALQCKLKEDCSTHMPVFIVTGLSDTTCNYAQWVGTGRVYWIDDIVFLTNDIVEVHCHLDVLGTYANYIRDNHAFLSYANEYSWNSEIDDGRFSPEVQLSSALEASRSDNFGLHFGYDDGGGTVVIAGMDCYAGGVRYYACRPSEFITAMAELSGTAIDAAINGNGDSSKKWNLQEMATQAGEDLAKLFGVLGGTGSWRDNLISATFIPLDYDLDYSGTSRSEIYLGCVKVNLDCKELPAMLMSTQRAHQFMLPTWPSLHNDLPFLKNSRWTKWQVVTPAGYCELNGDLIRRIDRILLNFSLNKTTGEWSLTIGDFPGNLILSSFNGNIGVDITGTVGTGKSFGQGLINAASNIAATATKLLGIGTNIETNTTSPQTTERSKKSGEDTSATKISHAEAQRIAQSKRAKLSIASNIFGSICDSLCNNGNSTGSLGGGITSLAIMEPTTAGGTDIAFFTLARKCWVPRFLDGATSQDYIDFCDKHGYPSNRWMKIGDNTGYLVCAGAYVQNITGATPEDLSTINGYLNSGVINEQHL